MLKKLRSRIHEFLDEDVLKKLDRVCMNRTISDNNIKAKAMLQILRDADVSFNELGSGTNRLAVLIDSYVFKFALDPQGKRDNMNEYKLSPELQPHVCKTYETNELVSVHEYITVISREEFEANMDYLREVLGILAQSYLLGDVGLVTKNFCNWGYRDDGSMVILDFALIQQINPEDIMCTLDQSLLEYDSKFYNLICPKCGRKYSFMDISRRITSERERQENELSKAMSYVLHEPMKEVTERTYDSTGEDSEDWELLTPAYFRNNDVDFEVDQSKEELEMRDQYIEEDEYTRALDEELRRKRAKKGLPPINDDTSVNNDTTEIEPGTHLHLGDPVAERADEGDPTLLNPEQFGSLVDFDRVSNATLRIIRPEETAQETPEPSAVNNEPIHRHGRVLEVDALMNAGSTLEESNEEPVREHQEEPSVTSATAQLVMRDSIRIEREEEPAQEPPSVPVGTSEGSVTMVRTETKEETVIVGPQGPEERVVVKEEKLEVDNRVVSEHSTMTIRKATPDAAVLEEVQANAANALPFDGSETERSRTYDSDAIVPAPVTAERVFIDATESVASSALRNELRDGDNTDDGSIDPPYYSNEAVHTQYTRGEVPITIGESIEEQRESLIDPEDLRDEHEHLYDQADRDSQMGRGNKNWR